MARFQDRVSIQPVNTQTGYAQGTNSLLNRLQQFKSSSENLIDVVETKRGKEEAANVELKKVNGTTQAPKKKDASIGELILTGGTAAKAYNKELQTAYLASLGNDTQEAIAAIEAENQDNIAAFNEKAQGYVNGVLKGVDPTVQGQVARHLDNTVTNSRIRVHRKTIEKNKKNAASESATAIEGFANESARLAREGNQVGSGEAMLSAYSTIDGMVEAGSLPADAAAKMKREINRESTEQGIRKQFDDIATNQGIDAAFQELESRSQKIPKGWTPDEWDTFVASEQADLRQKAVRLTQAQADKTVQTSKQVSDLKIQANTGFDATGREVDPSKVIGDAERMFANGEINGSTRASVITSVFNRQKKDVDNSKIYAKVANKLGGAVEIPLTQKEVDLTWDDQYKKGVDSLPVGQKNAAITEFIKQTKITPASVKNQVNNNLNSEDPVLVNESIDLMQRMDQVRGIPSDNFSPNQRAFADEVFNLSQNMDPAEALQLARKNTDPTDRTRIESRKAELKDLEIDYADEIDSEFNPFIGTDTIDSVNAGKMEKEYKALFDSHYVAGMSESKAKEKAFEIMSRNWGESNTTGKPRMMRYRPEDYYSVAGETDYIGVQLHKAVIDSYGLPEVSREQILLVSDETTSRQAASGQPSYLVVLDMGEEGLMPLINQRFTPDMKEEVERQQGENKKNLEKRRTADIIKQFDNINLGSF